MRLAATRIGSTPFREVNATVAAEGFWEMERGVYRRLPSRVGGFAADRRASSELGGVRTGAGDMVDRLVCAAELDAVSRA